MTRPVDAVRYEEKGIPINGLRYIPSRMCRAATG